jgi:hypothetical protein
VRYQTAPQPAGPPNKSTDARERYLSVLPDSETIPNRRTTTARPLSFFGTNTLIEPGYLVMMHWYAHPESDTQQRRIAPRLASWDKADHPDQVRLRASLDDIEALLAGSRVDGPWALRLDVGLPIGRDLPDTADLDNYAYPLASHLQDPGLVSVWCTKQAQRAVLRADRSRHAISRPQPIARVSPLVDLRLRIE